MNIEEEIMRDGFTKYHLKDFPFNAVIHKISDVDLRFHDHPWGFSSFIIKGGYKEKVLYKDADGYKTYNIIRGVGDSFNIKATHIHKIIELFEEESWSLIIPGK